MTTEERQDKFDEKLNAIDKRQESFETFVKAYIQKTDQSLAEQRERMNRFEAKCDATDARIDNLNAQLNSRIDGLSAQMHNLTIATTVGVAAIVVTIIMTTFVK